MKLLVIDTTEGYNGSSVLIAGWAAALRRRGLDAVALITADPAGPPARVYAAAGVPIVSGTISLDPETVPVFLGVMAAPLITQMGRPQRSIWLLREGAAGAVWLAARADAAALCASLAALVFHHPVQSTRIFAAMLYGVDRDRIHVVPPGTEIPTQGAAGTAEASLRIATLGAIGSSNRQGDLLVAMAGLTDVDVSAELIGRVGTLEPAACAAAGAMALRVRFHGELPPQSACSLLDRCNAICVPSPETVAPLALLEGTARGLTPLLVDVPAFRDRWHHGRNCLLHQPGDTAMLAWHLRILASDTQLRARLGTAARTTAARFPTATFHAGMDLVLASLT